MARPAPAGARLRNEAHLSKGERKVAAGLRKAFNSLTAYARHALEQSGLNPDTLDPNAKPWRDALTKEVTPALMAVYKTAWDSIAAGVPDLDPGPFAVRHIESVWNRLVNTSDDVFDAVRVELTAGRLAGESIPALSARIDTVLGDTNRWAGRATTIARTETIGANNAGSRAAAQQTGVSLGVAPEAVARTWLATTDERTRESHADADGQTIFGMDAAYQVGGAELAYPGDPDGPPEEVINCRCTETFSYPGDPDYPAEGLAASASRQETTMHARWAKRVSALDAIAAASDPDGDMTPVVLTAAGDPADGDTPTSVIICALPATDDPCQDIGPEDKHATLCYLAEDASTIDLDAVKAALDTWAPPAPGDEDVTGVDSLGDQGARVWMIAPGGLLSDLRASLTDLDPIGALDTAANTHPTFTPHVTIGYPETPELTDGTPALLDPDVEEAAAGITSITFDRVALWAGTDRTEYPLMSEEPAVAASAVPTMSGGFINGAKSQIDAMVAAGHGTREECARMLAAALRAAAGDPAPVKTEDDMAAGDPAPPLDQVEAEDTPEAESGDDKFWGVCLTEDSQTGDGRVFAAGAVRWGELPMPAGWIPQDGDGHDNAIVMGRIDTLARVGNFITYTGTYDLDGAGWEVRRLVDGQFLTGLSVDTDDCAIEFLMPDGTPVDAFDMMFGDGDEDPIMTVTDSRIRSFAVCRVPAMEGSQAFIANGLPVGDGTVKPGMVEEAPAPTEEEAAPAVAASLASLVASGKVTSLDAWRPDPSVFRPPAGLEDNPTSLTVSTDGRTFHGYLAEFGVCHIGYDGVCIDPPPSLSDYAYFACGEVICSDGSKVRVGQLTMDTGHAPLGENWRATVAHYDNTGTAIADFAIGEDGHGIWMAGRVRPDAAPEKVEALRAAGKVSGDWREVVRGSGQLELVAALVVNVPGFPVPKLGVSASGGRQTALVAAGIAATPAERAIIAAGHRIPNTDSIRDIVRDELAAERRRGLVASAGARIRARRVADATARIGRS